ncbi:MAG: glutathione binding-like protein [Beijerinckiaceae bacterium]|jgi:GST-like protein
MIELHYWPTTNGQKIALFLEEGGADWAARPVNIQKGQQFDPEFLKISPNNKIPAILDRAPAGGGEPLGVFESGAILLYLAEKTGRFLPADPVGKARVTQWVFWQIGGLGPASGQANVYVGEMAEKNPGAAERTFNELKRLYKVMDGQLARTAYLGGSDYSIADMACYPTIVNHERHKISLDDHPNVKRWVAAIRARPAVQRAYERAEAIRKAG